MGNFSFQPTRRPPTHLACAPTTHGPRPTTLGSVLAMLLELNMVQMENIHNFQLTFRKIDVTNDGEVSKVRKIPIKLYFEIFIWNFTL